MAYSPLTCKFIPAYEGNYTKGRNTNIREICIHHIDGNCSIEVLGQIWQTVGRYGSSTYGIGSDGRIACYVDENDTAWCNSNWDSNCRSVSIEVADDNVNPYHSSDYAINSLIRLVADVAKRNNMGTLVKGQNVTWHSMYANTECPGTYLLSKMDYIINEANKINGGSTAPDQVLTVGSKCKFNGVFKINEIILPNSKYPNGAVGSYATCYGSPCGKDDYIPCGPIGICDSNGNNVNYNGVAKVGGYWTCDKIFTVIGVEYPTRYTPNGVAILEADGVRFRVDCGPLLEV